MWNEWKTLGTLPFGCTHIDQAPAYVGHVFLVCERVKNEVEIEQIKERG